MIVIDLFFLSGSILLGQTVLGVLFPAKGTYWQVLRFQSSSTVGPAGFQIQSEYFSSEFRMTQKIDVTSLFCWERPDLLTTSAKGC